MKKQLHFIRLAFVGAVLFTVSSAVAQEEVVVNIPDENMKQILVENLEINTNEDDEIQISEAVAYTGAIDLLNMGIQDLTGIEAFVNITELDCSENQLTSLDVSANTELKKLYCYDNQLESLNLNQNTLLELLSCENNQLTSLDVSANTELKKLYCYDNQLESLNLSQNTLLELLSCENNQLTSLDLTYNPSLKQLHCAENLITFFQGLGTNLVELICQDNKLTSLDLSHCTSLNKLFCENNELISLNVKNGNNTNFINFSAIGNPYLSCIKVDDAQGNYLANWNKDQGAEYSEDCESLTTGDQEAVLSGLYPNPVLSNLSVLVKNSQKGDLYDAMGKKLQEIELVEGLNQVSMEYLSAGIYFLVVGNQTYKIVKQ
ncbi:T9SS type A sorting domain-containing protein [Capnocytophaga sp. ARDL2]|uniref:T9SS type A sorting domain-containing protein n=1 Tax=Capnocytophaga sp. ARDL2 TaxID=3238809 RepID=UPI0035570DBF